MRHRLISNAKTFLLVASVKSEFHTFISAAVGAKPAVIKAALREDEPPGPYRGH